MLHPPRAAGQACETTELAATARVGPGIALVLCRQRLPPDSHRATRRISMSVGGIKGGSSSFQITSINFAQSVMQTGKALLDSPAIKGLTDGFDRGVKARGTEGAPGLNKGNDQIENLKGLLDSLKQLLESLQKLLGNKGADAAGGEGAGGAGGGAG